MEEQRGWRTGPDLFLTVAALPRTLMKGGLALTLDPLNALVPEWHLTLPQGRLAKEDPGEEEEEKEDPGEEEEEEKEGPGEEDPWKEVEEGEEESDTCGRCIAMCADVMHAAWCPL